MKRSDALPIGVIAFRPLALKDLPLLHEWLERPHVAEWWTPTPSLEEIEQEFGPLISHQSTTRAYLVLGDEEPSATSSPTSRRIRGTSGAREVDTPDGRALLMVCDRAVGKP